MDIVLFACVHNAGRSQMAAAFFNQQADPRRAVALSAGTQPADHVHPEVLEVMREVGVDLVSARPRRLTRDPMYNARLGTEYLARMLARYDGSYVLATAAYNAGPGRVDQWIGAAGDPRDPGIDPVIWIELIPFSETRNYVMRVLEALHVYRARLQGHAAPVQLVADINRTG